MPAVPTPYLRFEGRCAEALTFYAQALGAKLAELHRYGDAPAGENMPPAPADWVMHGRLVWPNGAMLMASDGGMGPHDGYKGITLTVNPATLDEGRQVFAALSEGGQVQMPFSPTFWAIGFGMLVDRFGVPWMVNVEVPK